MTKPPAPKNQPEAERPSRLTTTHNRVLAETSDRANELARRWGTTKMEVYRYLVDLAHEGKINPQ